LSGTLDDEIRSELGGLAAEGALKTLRTIDSPPGPLIRFDDGREVICLCSSDYLGLAGDPSVVAAATEGLQRYGAGTASMRTICGRFTPHVQLEADLADFLETEAAITYVSCWNANQAVLDTLCDKRTWVLSDELNNPSIIDGIRLARPGGKAVYEHADVASLEQALGRVPAGARCLIVTDGVFGTDGDLAPLPDLVELADDHGATLIVDDSHGLGVLGLEGRGTAEYFGIDGRIDIITGTLGKALGGAAGGFIAGSRPLCDLLEQRSRSQLFSNSLPQSVACGARAALGELTSNAGCLRRLRANVNRFRSGVTGLGLEPLDGASAIVPVIIGDTSDAIAFSDRLLAEGVLAIAFGFPIVPEGTARIRVQLSATLTEQQVDTAVAAFGRAAEAQA
jgi:glycine C-acetyltransferase